MSLDNDSLHSADLPSNVEMGEILDLIGLANSERNTFCVNIELNVPFRKGIWDSTVWQHHGGSFM